MKNGIKIIVSLSIIFLLLSCNKRRQVDIEGRVYNPVTQEGIAGAELWLLKSGPITEFLGEWLQPYEGYTIGDFVTADSQIWSEGDKYYIRSTTWLAPYDLGVAQELHLWAVPGQAPGVYTLGLELQRVSGEVDNWVNVNGRFLANLRKQFLTWRTLTAEQRSKYESAAVERFQTPTVA